MEQRTILEPCCKCGKIPIIKQESGNLFYVICHCHKWDRYEHLGSTINNAIERWNDANRCISRIGNPRKK